MTMAANGCCFLWRVRRNNRDDRLSRSTSGSCVVDAGYLRDRNTSHSCIRQCFRSGRRMVFHGAERADLMGIHGMALRTVVGMAAHRGGTGADRQSVVVVATLQQPDLAPVVLLGWQDRSEEHTSELQSLMRISYAV